MAILPITLFPDKILEQKCDKVTKFDAKLAKLLRNMHDTMIEADGVGLAAPQVGIKKQIAVVEVDEKEGIIEMINPEVLEVSGTQSDLEGCLSFPGVYGEVERPFKVKIKAQDRKGKLFELEAEEFLARAILHEIDHLHGVLFTTKVTKYFTEEELERYEAQ